MKFILNHLEETGAIVLGTTAGVLGDVDVAFSGIVLYLLKVVISAAIGAFVGYFIRTKLNK